jgi:hypothetical protein
MKSCMTWMKRLQCSLSVGMLDVILEIISSSMKWKKGLGNLWTYIILESILIPSNIPPTIEWEVPISTKVDSQ